MFFSRIARSWERCSPGSPVSWPFLSALTGLDGGSLAYAYKTAPSVPHVVTTTQAGGKGEEKRQWCVCPLNWSLENNFLGSLNFCVYLVGQTMSECPDPNLPGSASLSWTQLRFLDWGRREGQCWWQQYCVSNLTAYALKTYFVWPSFLWGLFWKTVYE